ncbi:MAG: PQQ-like beta-propeller repeat protein [Bacteroidales bacterium]|nr:PQQ-like beta-propeller repeat protein [Bacteroidales bacterium]
MKKTITIILAIIITTLIAQKLSAQLHEIWSVPVAKTGINPLLSFDDRLLAIGEDGAVHCVNIETGEKLWTVEFGIETEPNAFIADSVLFIQFSDGTLGSIDLLTGNKKWDKKLTIYSNIVTDGEVIYFAPDNMSMKAITCYDGSTIWQETMESEISSNLCYEFGKIFYLTSKKEIIGIDAITGESDWRFETKYDIITNLYVAENKLCFAMRIPGRSSNESFNKFVVAVDIPSATELWRFEFLDALVFPKNPFVLFNNILLVIAGREIYTFNAARGIHLWHFPHGGFNPVAYDGFFYFTGILKMMQATPDLICLESVTGKLIFNHNAGMVPYKAEKLVSVVYPIPLVYNDIVVRPLKKRGLVAYNMDSYREEMTALRANADTLKIARVRADIPVNGIWSIVWITHESKRKDTYTVPYKPPSLWQARTAEVNGQSSLIGVTLGFDRMPLSNVSLYFDLNRSGRSFIAGETRTIKGLEYKYPNKFYPTKELSDILNSNPRAKEKFDEFLSMQEKVSLIGDYGLSVRSLQCLYEATEIYNGFSSE